MTHSPRRARSQDGAHVPRHLGLALFVIAAAQLMIILDATIVNVALPQMQRALGFSGSGLEWIVTAYSLAFGSLLLLGGRLGDLYGRRRIFMTGVAVFSIGSLLGGFANGEEFLLSARVLQGAGAALAAPTALALIATTFPPGPPRNRALGVYAGMSGAGGAIGLLLGGILTTYVSWRWVFFVNVPIGAMVVFALSPFALATSGRQRGRLDIPGVITSTAGLALLVYGLTEAAAGQDGVSHWGDTNVIAALAASAVLLVGFVFIETRSTHPELPLHLLKSRRRSGAYIMMLLIGTAMFAVFFFLTLFTQTVLGFSPVKAGVAWVPFPLMIIVISMVVARVLLTRIGVRPLLLAGPLLAGIGFMWLSQLSVTSTYWANLLPADARGECRAGAHVRAADADGRLARAERRAGRRVRRAQRGPADRRRDRPRGHRHDRLDRGREQRPDPDGEWRRRRGSGRRDGPRRHPDPGVLPGADRRVLDGPDDRRHRHAHRLPGRHRHDVDSGTRPAELGRARGRQAGM